VSEKFGSLTFAEFWLVCRAKGNVPNVGRKKSFFLVRWAKNKKHWDGLRDGFLVLSIFLFSVLSQWFTFQFIVVSVFFLHLAVTVNCMSSGRLRGTFLSNRYAV